MDGLIASKIAILVQEGILKGDISKTSPTQLIAKGMEIMETFPNMNGSQKKQLLVKVVEKVAAGADGIAGTEDDIIPKSVVDALKTLLEKNLVEDIVQVMLSAAKGEFNLEKNKEVAVELVAVTKSCIPVFLEKIKNIYKNKTLHGKKSK